MSWKPKNRPSRVPSWVPAPVRWLMKWGFIIVCILFCVALYYVYLASKFDMSLVEKMPERTVILDRNGVEFAAVHGERRRSITYKEIPEDLILALRAREDLRFPNHCGIDFRGLARATLRNIKDWSFTQGASTLTMQLARNSYEMRAKSLHRKILEIALTLRIEDHYTKEEILTHYLNRIYFGSGCHGVEEAAQTYFGKSTKELTTGQSALLVGIIRGPHIFSPFRNLNAAIEQRDEVLDRMVICHFLTKEEMEVAKKAPLHLVQKKERSRGSSYVRESIRQQLDILLEKHNIRDGGLKIHTTLDAKTQWKCDKFLNNPIAGLEKKTDHSLQAAVVKLDKKTGGIIALCGGRSYKTSQFNRAYGAQRDLGNIYMPFLYSLALERGKLAIKNKPLQTGRQLGITETIRLSRRLELNGHCQETEDLYRGAIAASPMELAIATAILSNGGKKPRPYFISKIEDEKGNILYQKRPQHSQAISKDAAQDAVALIPKIKNKKQFISATSSVRDVWSIEISDTCITVLWLGYDSPQKIGASSAAKKSAQKLLNSFN